MRELKFRAIFHVRPEWMDEHEMYDDSSIYYSDHEPQSLADFFSVALGEKDNLKIIEQSTGLRDKNGKEIYEGDLIIGKGRYGIKSKKLRVMWDESSRLLPFYLIVDYEGEFWIDKYHNYEIIGNIHQNPELLGAV